MSQRNSRTVFLRGTPRGLPIRVNLEEVGPARRPQASRAVRGLFVRISVGGRARHLGVDLPRKCLRVIVVLGRRVFAAVVVVGVLAAGVLAAEPILHEYFDPDATPPPAEGTDAAQETASEEAAAPANVVQSPSTRSSGGSGPHASADAEKYSLDGNTSRPDRVGYSDPFVPSIPPFKRLHAYDSVNDALELVVADKSLVPISLASKTRAADDQFLAVIPVTLGREPFRIPSVGPMTRVVGAKLQPRGDFQIVADSAENWFVRGDGGSSAELTLHLSVDRRVFGSTFADVSWATLARALPPLPDDLVRHAAPVLSRLELSQAVSPPDAVERLVAYFRDFAPSEQQSTLSGAELYESIALSQRGVCRHRSFAFAVTAFALGLPNRFVHNEAHAWVEVFDGALWHRIDLGGAAGDVQLGGQLDVPHVLPTDPFQWPSSSESGQDMVNQALGQSSGAGGNAASAADDSPTSSGPSDDHTESDADVAAPAEPSSASPSADAMPSATALEVPVPTAQAEQATEDAAAKATVALSAEVREALRGGRVAVRGRIRGGEDCSLLRVNVMLRGASGSSRPLGVLVTDASGRFAGEVVVPESVPVGDYEMFVATTGNERCPAAHSD